MRSFTTVAKVGDIPEGRAEAFAVNGRMVAVFHQDGRYLAMDDICPHMGASLATGHLEQGVVTCPWHAWRFNICDGSWCDNPQIKIDSFEVRVEGDEIQVHVPDTERSHSERSDTERADAAREKETPDGATPKDEATPRDENRPSENSS